MDKFLTIFKKIFLYLISFLIIFLILFYFIVVFVLPRVVNSPDFASKIEKVIFDKTNLKSEIKNLKLIVSKDLTAQISAEFIGIESVLRVEGVKIFSDIKTLKIKKADINYLFLDSEKLKSAFDEYQNNEDEKNKNRKNKKNKSGNNFILSKIFNLQILKADIVIKKVVVRFEDVIFNSTNKKTARYNLKAQKIPVEAVMRALLRFQKSKDPQKKFIENFKNYNGLMEFDLSYENKKLSGFIKAHKLSAISVLFNVPFYFEEPLFIIKDNVLLSSAKGTIGGNKAYHNLKIINILSKQRLTLGEVGAPIDERISKKYFPEDIKIIKSTDVKVKYHIQNKIPEVQYFVNLNKGSDVFYKTISLGLEDKNRKIYVKTIKRDNKLFLEKYIYSYSDFSEIVSGNALFVREKKKFEPEFITVKTNGFIPLSVIGSFAQNVDGGKIRGDLRYEFSEKNLIGKFELLETIFNDFYIKKASILSDRKTGYVKAEGEYKEEEFNSFIKFQNGFKEKIVIDDMNLYLSKFDILKNKKKDKNSIKAQGTSKDEVHNNKSQEFKEFSKKADNSNILIKNWQIGIGKLKYNKITLEKLKLSGKLENSIFEFLMPEINYAKGQLGAKGKYDFLDDVSDIYFYSKNIDSNYIAQTFFDLKNQINGIANADLRVKTFDDLDKICACADFEIKNGALTKIDSQISETLKTNTTEAKINKIKSIFKMDSQSKKKSDSNGENLLNADIKGEFEFNNFDESSLCIKNNDKTSNSILKNIDLTSKQEALSMYLSGDYDIKTRNADFDIFGKYNVEAPKGVKVFFVPLNWILNFVFLKKEDKQNYLFEVNKIPEFKIVEDKTNLKKPVIKKNIKEKLFKINLSGNLNKDKLKLDFRGLR